MKLSRFRIFLDCFCHMNWFIINFEIIIWPFFKVVAYTHCNGILCTLDPLLHTIEKILLYRYTILFFLEKKKIILQQCELNFFFNSKRLYFLLFFFSGGRRLYCHSARCWGSARQYGHFKVCHKDSIKFLRASLSIFSEYSWRRLLFLKK